MARGKSKTPAAPEVVEEASVQEAEASPTKGAVKVLLTKDFVFWKGRFYHKGTVLELEVEDANLLLNEGCAKEA